jgi:hypothetical protein
MPIARTRTRPDQYLSRMASIRTNRKAGERALILCMPITSKVRDEQATESEEALDFHYEVLQLR